MAVTGRLQPSFTGQVLNKEIDWDTDPLRGRLLSSSYTPDVLHDYANDLSGELATANGYTAGGVLLTTPTRVRTLANAWGAARANSTAYAVGDVVRPSTGNAHLYQCIVAGTSGGSPPSFPTVPGQIVTDGTVTWAEVGIAITVLRTDAASWTLSGSITARYFAIVDANTGADNTRPLIIVQDFGADETGNSQFNVTPHSLLGWAYAFDS
jgi:hypothetical protein